MIRQSAASVKQIKNVKVKDFSRKKKTVLTDHIFFLDGRAVLSKIMSFSKKL